MRRMLMCGLAIFGMTLGVVAGLVGPAQAGSRDKAVREQPRPIAWSGVAKPSRGPAQAIGGYAGGCLSGAAALNGEGAGYQVIRMSRGRYYGHPALVAFLEDFGRRMAADGLGTALVADMAQPRGGPMPRGHASHQSGLDADIWLRLDLAPMARKARESLHEINYVDYDRKRVIPAWSESHARMVHLAARDARVDRIFVNPIIKADLCRRDWKDRAWLRKVRPWYGHDGHMHVRLSCPKGSPDCAPQKALPEGEGCDEDIAWWLERIEPLTPIPADKAVTPDPKLPAACAAVFRANGTAVAEAERLQVRNRN